VPRERHYMCPALESSYTNFAFVLHSNAAKLV
jgi:hypothetical protein